MAWCFVVANKIHARVANPTGQARLTRRSIRHQYGTTTYSVMSIKPRGRSTHSMPDLVAISRFGETLQFPSDLHCPFLVGLLIGRELASERRQIADGLAYGRAYSWLQRSGSSPIEVAADPKQNHSMPPLRDA